MSNGETETPAQETGDKSTEDVEKVTSKMEETSIEEQPAAEPSPSEEKASDEPSVDEKKEEVKDGDDANQLDDDEIEENPAYIPKKGKYYMHDSRDDNTGEDEDVRKSRADGAWKHDRFDERWQRPKTNKQLLTKYGFNIRNKEGTEEDEGKPAMDRKPEQESRSNGKQSSPKNSRPPANKKAPRSNQPLDERRPQQERNPEVRREQRRERPRQEERRQSNEDSDDEMARPGDRRQRTGPARVVRNVRGTRGSYPANTARGRSFTRGQSARYGAGRGGGGNQRDSRDNRDVNDSGNDRLNERVFENHRRGAIRGAVRGGGYPRGNNARPFNPNNRYDREPRDNDHYNRNQDDGPRAPRGGYSRGGAFVPRATYTSRGSHRGGPPTHAPPMATFPSKRYHGPPENGGNMPPLRGHPMNAPPPGPRAFIPRQPTDVVYFDPSPQIQASRQPLPPREKKVMAIVPPPN